MSKDDTENGQQKEMTHHDSSLVSWNSLKRLCLQINVSDIVKEMRRQRHGMIQTKVSAHRGRRSAQFTLSTPKLHVAFVCLVSGTVSLLPQGLVGGFTGHFTASRRPMATGKSPNSKVAECLQLAGADSTADIVFFPPCNDSTWYY